MPSWSVSARGIPPIQVAAPNWIAALGVGLEGLGQASSIQRLACEMLPNGTVIARDIATGTGFVIQPLLDDDDLVVDEFPTIAEEDMLELTSERTAERSRFEPIHLAETPLVACQVALLLAKDLVPAESGAVILEDKGWLRFVAVAGPHARRLASVRLPQGSGIAGFAMKNRRTLVLAEAHEDPRHCGEIDALTGYVTRDIAVVPLVDGDVCIGVVELMNLREGHRFSTSEVDALQSVAKALAARLARG